MVDGLRPFACFDRGFQRREQPEVDAFAVDADVSDDRTAISAVRNSGHTGGIIRAGLIPPDGSEIRTVFAVELGAFAQIVDAAHLNHL